MTVVNYGSLPELVVKKSTPNLRRNGIESNSVLRTAVLLLIVTVAVIGITSSLKSSDDPGEKKILNNQKDYLLGFPDDDDEYGIIDTLSKFPSQYYKLDEDAILKIGKSKFQRDVDAYSYSYFYDDHKPGIADHGQGRLVHPKSEIDTSYAPSDPLATDLTKQLYQSLHDVSMADSFLFGHQNTAAKGQKFRDPAATHHLSDINIATNGSEWAAVYGFNLWEVFNGSTLIHFVKSAYMKGAVIEMEWEADNPITGEPASDCTGNPMNHITPGGSLNDVWMKELDVIVDEVSKYVIDGIMIPVVLRLFHENTGTWYWWGSTCANSSAYVSGFQYTVDYLRDAGLHNLLIVYAPSKPSRYKNTAFDELYPGNDYVDIVAFDRYGLVEYGIDIVDDAALVVPFARRNRKVPALAETGFYKGSYNIGKEFLVNDSSWWTDAFLKPIVEDGNASQIAYAITWTNYAKDCYWIPLKGDYTYDGFVHMAHSPEVLFIDDTRWVNLPYSHSIQLARKQDGWSRRLESVEEDMNDITELEDLAAKSKHSKRRHHHKHHHHSSESTSIVNHGKSYDHGWWRCSMPSSAGT